MIRNIAWFALGFAAATAVFLSWHFGSSRGDSPGTGDAPGQLVESELGSDGTIETPNSAEPFSRNERSTPDVGSVSRPGERPTAAPDSASGLATDRAASSSASPLSELAAATSRTPEELERMLERSFAFLGESPNRHDVFARKESDKNGSFAGLEAAVANQVWQAVGGRYPPGSVKTECRSVGCRVSLKYADSKEALVAANSSVDLRLFAELDYYDFAAVEEKFEPGSFSGSQGVALDIFLWRANGQ